MLQDVHCIHAVFDAGILDALSRHIVDESPWMLVFLSEVMKNTEFRRAFSQQKELLKNVLSTTLGSQNSNGKVIILAMLQDVHCSRAVFDAGILDALSRHIVDESQWMLVFLSEAMKNTEFRRAFSQQNELLKNVLSTTLGSQNSNGKAIILAMLQDVHCIRAVFDAGILYAPSRHIVDESQWMLVFLSEVIKNTGFRRAFSQQNELLKMYYPQLWVLRILMAKRLYWPCYKIFTVAVLYLTLASWTR
ncbi:hypothetical protein C8J57DRAFT_1354858 [Mycena rebaudengoi]|nr:hypothetical protein C8J57DRAFT_1354858 [Mycena rebaudengoi]